MIASEHERRDESEQRGGEDRREEERDRLLVRTGERPDAAQRALLELHTFDGVGVSSHHRMWRHSHALTLRARRRESCAPTGPDGPYAWRRMSSTRHRSPAASVATVIGRPDRWSSPPSLSGCKITHEEASRTTGHPRRQRRHHDHSPPVAEAGPTSTSSGTATGLRDRLGGDRRTGSIEVVSRCPSTTPTHRVPRWSSRSPATRRRPRRGSASSRRTTVAPVPRPARWPSTQRRGSRPRSPIDSTSCRGIRGAPAQSGGSVDCIDDAEYDQFYAAPDLTPDDDAERQAVIDLAEDFAAALRRARRRPRRDRHEQHRPRPRCHPSGARRGAALVLRVQLRQRTRWRVDDDVPDDRARRRVRRCHRPERHVDRTSARPVDRIRGGAQHVPRRVQRRLPTARSTTTATPRERSTR